MMSSGNSAGQKMKKKFGLESKNISGSSSGGSSSNKMESSSGSGMKESMGKKIDQLKDTMGLKK
jgi:hypothetical protein